MTVKEFMESQINHFASQIREKATTLTRKMRSDFEASKLDYMEQLDTAKEQLEQEQINNQATNSDLATETTEINGDTTTDSMKTSSTSSSSSTSKPNAPSTTSSSSLPPPNDTRSKTKSTTTTTKSTAKKITHIVLTVIDRNIENKDEEISNPYQGRVFTLEYSARRRIMVGRSTGKKYTEKGLSLSEDGEVSTSHGDFRTQKGNIVFVDLESTNGSRINGDVLVPFECNLIKEGDMLLLGATQMKVSFA